MFLAVVFASYTTCDMNLRFSCVDGALAFSLDAQLRHTIFLSSTRARIYIYIIRRYFFSRMCKNVCTNLKI